MNCRSIAKDVLDALDKYYEGPFHIGVSNRDSMGNISYHYRVTIRIGDKEGGFIFPREYNNLWPTRAERAVRETLENINMLP